jgi:uncharacterized protein YchJ
MEVGGRMKLEEKMAATASSQVTDEERRRMKEEYDLKPSKMGNRVCYCGSNLKFKKCCMGETEAK